VGNNGVGEKGRVHAKPATFICRLALKKKDGGN
jgi:hypothetical protein